MMCNIQYATFNLYPDVSLVAVAGRLNYSVAICNIPLILRYIAALVRQ